MHTVTMLPVECLHQKRAEGMGTVEALLQSGACFFALWRPGVLLCFLGSCEGRE